VSFFKHEKALVAQGAKVGEGTRVWANTNILNGAIIGEHCNICDGCYVEGRAVIGNYVTLKNGVAVFDGVTLQDDVFVGSGVAFINDRNPRSHRADAWVLEKTLIQKGASLGANATILCGVTVGPYAIIGAGAVVTRDVPAHTIVVGNPAQQVGYACRCGHRLDPDFKCACGTCYQIHNNTIAIL
jgi:acetyltransferase-like isoleucine patch superfamily enzyme